MIAQRLLKAVEESRYVLTRAQAEIPIHGEEYKAINRVVDEIDGLAAVLTGNREHFHLKSPSVRA